MDAINIINNILSEFSAECGLGSVQLDDEGVLSLCFDDKLKVTLIYLSDRDKLIMEADVANPKELGEGIFQQLICFNRHWYQFDLHFGYDEEHEKVQLYRQLSASQLTRERFEKSLAEVLDHCEFWQELLSVKQESVPAVGVSSTSMRV